MVFYSHTRARHTHTHTHKQAERAGQQKTASLKVKVIGLGARGISTIARLSGRCLLLLHLGLSARGMRGPAAEACGSGLLQLVGPEQWATWPVVSELSWSHLLGVGLT